MRIWAFWQKQPTNGDFYMGGIMLDQPAGSHYWSTFALTHSAPEELKAWADAYACYLEENIERYGVAGSRPGWCQKKADQDWEQFL